MEFFGYRLEKISTAEAKELERAKEVLEKHGFRAVKVTADKSKKRASAERANQAKQKITAEKLQNGLSLWRMEASDKPLTAYRLSKLSGVAQKTAQKYLEKIKVRENAL